MANSYTGEVQATLPGRKNKEKKSRLEDEESKEQVEEKERTPWASHPATHPLSEPQSKKGRKICRKKKGKKLLSKMQKKRNRISQKSWMEIGQAQTEHLQ